MFKSHLIALAIAGQIGAAQATDTSAQEILLYSDARHTLLQRGFHPYVMPGSASCDEQGPRCYPELVGCTHKRLWICDYTWKGGQSVYQGSAHRLFKTAR